MRTETIQHIANSWAGTPVRELLLEADEAFVYTAIEKGLDMDFFMFAWKCREEDLLPMKWTLNRFLNENGRVFKNYEEQKKLLTSTKYRHLLRRYHRRLDVGKEYAQRLEKLK